MISSILFLLIAALLIAQSMQASKRRAAEVAQLKESNEKSAEEASSVIDRQFIANLSRADGSKVPADIGSVSRILQQWDPEPQGEVTDEGEYDDIAEKVVKQLRRDVDAQKVAKVLKDEYLNKYAKAAANTEGIANYIVNWWHAYVLA